MSNIYFVSEERTWVISQEQEHNNSVISSRIDLKLGWNVSTDLLTHDLMITHLGFILKKQLLGHDPSTRLMPMMGAHQVSVYGK